MGASTPLPSLFRKRLRGLCPLLSGPREYDKIDLDVKELHAGSLLGRGRGEKEGDGKRKQKKVRTSAHVKWGWLKAPSGKFGVVWNKAIHQSHFLPSTRPPSEPNFLPPPGSQLGCRSLSSLGCLAANHSNPQVRARPKRRGAMTQSCACPSPNAKPLQALVSMGQTHSPLPSNPSQISQNPKQAAAGPSKATSVPRNHSR